jgi:hypothetical protein
VAGGLSEIKDKLKKLEAGGVLFIDEAYQLNPAKNPMGAQVGALGYMHCRCYSNFVDIQTMLTSCLSSLPPTSS